MTDKVFDLTPNSNVGLSPGSGKESYVQRLANELGADVVVEGPDNFVWYYPSGSTIVAPPNTGDTWETYTEKTGKSGPNRGSSGSYNKFKCGCDSN